MNIRVVGATAVALLLSAAQQGQTCVIVTNGAVEVYQHEIAHCNGWTHPPFQRGAVPPSDYIHPYDGQLTVYLTGTDYAGQMDTMIYAQPGAEFIMKWNDTVPRLCKEFWREQGVIPASKDADDIIGCSIQ